MNDSMMLNYIRQNLDMGIEGITKVIPCAKNPSLKKALEDQLYEYRELYLEADSMLRRGGGEEKNASPMAKLGADIVTEIKCMTSYDDDSKIAEDMIRGTTNGITKLSRHLGEYKNAKPDIVDLSKKVIRTEEKNVEEMKEYL